jgi:hypothetical protein
MEIMIPVWEQSAAPQIAKSDLALLKGTEVALVDDNLDAAFTDQLELKLREAYGAVVKRLIKPLGSAPSPKSLIEEAAKYRVAIVGIGL